MITCFGLFPAHLLCAGIQSWGTQNRPALPWGLHCHGTWREGCSWGRPSWAQTQGRQVLREAFLEEVTLGSSLEGLGVKAQVNEEVKEGQRRTEGQRCAGLKTHDAVRKPGCGRRPAETVQREAGGSPVGDWALSFREIQTSSNQVLNLGGTISFRPTEKNINPLKARVLSLTLPGVSLRTTARRQPLKVQTVSLTLPGMSQLRTMARETASQRALSNGLKGVGSVHV